MLFANGVLCYRFGGRVLFLTVPAVAIISGWLDLAWIRSEMAKPGWDGQPDQDAVFIIGVILRISIASVLLFASFVATFALSSVIQKITDNT